MNVAPVYGPTHFLNRELSWLEFNQRVLAEALDPANPLLERVKFFCITSSNLDEFFEVRVAGLKQQLEADVLERSVDGLTPAEIFRAVTERVRRLVADQYRCWREDLTPALAAHGIRFLHPGELDAEDGKWVADYYRTQVRPVTTPLALDPAHPFPQLLNKSLNLMVRLELSKDGETLRHQAVVQVPRNLPRLVRLPRADARQDYVLLSQMIGHFLADLFPGTQILGYWSFRVTRNSEMYIDMEDTPNLLKAVEKELQNRRRNDAVRLELDHACPVELRAALLGTLRLTEDDVYLINGPLNATRLMMICEGGHSPELRDPPFIGPVLPALAGRADLFAAIRERDLLLHHPYDSFETVVKFLEQSAADPNVLAIKQTLYRTGGDQRIVGALMEAVRNGKQVTVVVELRARFDEANNVKWSRQLEEAGVHVVFGLVGFKIHAKMCLVVRRDPDGLRRYLHLGTGNYNATTARIYTDVSLFTCRPSFGEDATNLFNLLTGIAQFQGTEKLLVAPFELRDHLLALIAREADHARQGLPARIIAKMNALVDPGMITALYEASQAGVKIDLIIRGVCCLRPGLSGLSENITVRSIVDRFLEHSRVFYFENACQPRVYVGSADWMPRNLFRRIEVVFPIEDGTLRERLIADLLAHTLADNVKAWHLQADGTYRRAVRQPDETPVRSQLEFIRRSLPPVSGAGGGRRKKHPVVKLAPRPSGA